MIPHIATVVVRRFGDGTAAYSAVCSCGWRALGPDRIEAEDLVVAHEQEWSA